MVMEGAASEEKAAVQESLKRVRFLHRGMVKVEYEQKCAYVW